MQAREKHLLLSAEREAAERRVLATRQTVNDQDASLFKVRTDIEAETRQYSWLSTEQECWTRKLAEKTAEYEKARRQHTQAREQQTTLREQVKSLEGEYNMVRSHFNLKRQCFITAWLWNNIAPRATNFFSMAPVVCDDRWPEQLEAEVKHLDNKVRASSHKDSWLCSRVLSNHHAHCLRAVA